MKFCLVAILFFSAGTSFGKSVFCTLTNSNDGTVTKKQSFPINSAGQGEKGISFRLPDLWGGEVIYNEKIIPSDGPLEIRIRKQDGFEIRSRGSDKVDIDLFKQNISEQIHCEVK